MCRFSMSSRFLNEKSRGGADSLTRIILPSDLLRYNPIEQNWMLYSVHNIYIIRKKSKFNYQTTEGV